MFIRLNERYAYSCSYAYSYDRDCSYACSYACSYDHPCIIFARIITMNTLDDYIQVFKQLAKDNAFYAKFIQLYEDEQRMPEIDYEYELKHKKKEQHSHNNANTITFPIQAFRKLYPKFSLERVIYEGNLSNDEKLEVISSLIHSDADDLDKSCALQYVILANNEVLAEQIIEHGADVNNFSNHYGTPLMCACQIKNLSIVKMLVEHDADIDQMINDKTALSVASRSGSFEIVQYLCEHGANPFRLPDNYRGRANDPYVLTVFVDFMNAMANSLLIKGRQWAEEDTQIFRYLLEYISDIDESERKIYLEVPLLYAVECENREAIVELIQHGADINYAHGRFDTIFEYVCYPSRTQERTEYLRFLISLGVDLSDNARIIYWAACRNIHVVRSLKSIIYVQIV